MCVAVPLPSPREWEGPRADAGVMTAAAPTESSEAVVPSVVVEAVVVVGVGVAACLSLFRSVLTKAVIVGGGG